MLDPEIDIATARHWSRDQAEKDLIFAGLLIVDCPLKKDTAGVLRELQVSQGVRVCVYASSSHRQTRHTTMSTYRNQGIAQ